ncbi:MAG: ComF family protein [Candidatus Moranbacteria bacterium]|nr:ComF family protein [Candidatus Moranbacteria bacterium]
MSLIKKIHRFVLDTFFPIRCLSCQKEGMWLCEICQTKILLQVEHVCPICEKMITPDGRTCLGCKNKKSLNGMIVTCSYKQSQVAQLIHFFKYRFIHDLHVPLGKLLVAKLQKTDIPLPNMVVPVPLHPRRLRWRGFNQSALLAEHLAKNLLLGSELELRQDVLIRHRHTSPQMHIKDYWARQSNIAGAFSVLPDADVKNKTILLVDDVATTGSTIFECAKILKIAGAKEVFAIVIARQTKG